MALHCVLSFIFFKFSAILVPLQLLCGTCSSFHLCIFINSVTCHFPLLLVLLVCIVSFKFSKPPFLMYPQNFICHFLIGCNTCFLVLILLRTSSQKNYISEPLTTLFFFFFPSQLLLSVQMWLCLFTYWISCSAHPYIY